MKIIKNPSIVVEKFVILMRILGRKFGVNKEKVFERRPFLEITIYYSYISILYNHFCTLAGGPSVLHFVVHIPQEQ